MKSKPKKERIVLLTFDILSCDPQGESIKVNVSAYKQASLVK